MTLATCKIRALTLGLVIGMIPGQLLSRNSNARATQNTPSSKLRTVVCAVSGEDSTDLSMDAVVIVEDGKLLAPYKEDEEADQQRFAKEYFPAGRKYRLLLGGGQVGSATVKKSDKGCNNIHAAVTVDTSARIHGNVKALATNSEALGRKSGARRAPTAAERTAVLNLVKSIYLKRGVTAQLYRSLKVTNLTATDLDGDGKYEMVGSFTLAAKNKFERDLFLIAGPDAAGMRAEHVKFQAYQPPGEGFLSSIDFVDTLDLDGDGIGEVFAVQGGFDAYGYVIYKKQNGRWREVFNEPGDAC